MKPKSELQVVNRKRSLELRYKDKPIKKRQDFHIKDEDESYVILRKAQELNLPQNFVEIMVFLIDIIIKLVNSYLHSLNRNKKSCHRLRQINEKV